jgi:hypothetical protein
VAIVAALGVRLFAASEGLIEGLEFAQGKAHDVSESFMEMGSRLTDLSAKTKIGVTDLERLSYAGSLVGVSLEQVAQASGMLQRNLGNRNPAALNALQELGVNLDGLSQGGKFQAVMTALGGIADEEQQVALGAAIMGRGFMNVRALADENLAAILASAITMKDGTAEAADRLGEAWDRVERGGMALLSIPLAPLMNTWASNIEKAAEAARGLAGWMGFLAGGANVGALPTNVPGRPRSLNVGGIETPTMTFKEQTAIERELNTELRKNNAEYDQRLKKLQEFNKWLSDGPVPWKEGLSGMPGQQFGVPQMPFAPTFLPPMTSGVPGGLQAPVFNWGTPEEYAARAAPPPGIFESLAEKMKMTALPSFADVGLAGAGSMVNAVGQGLASGNWSGLVPSLTNSIGGLLGAAVNALVPGLGSILAPIFSGLASLFGGLFSHRSGRHAVEDFAASMGGFDALHEKLLRLGADGEALWVKLTQGTPAGNKELAAQNIQEVINALSRLPAAGNTALDGLLGDMAKIPPAAQAAARSMSEAEQAAKSMGGAVGGIGGAIWDVTGKPYGPSGTVSGIQQGDNYQDYRDGGGSTMPPWVSTGESTSGTTVNIERVYGSVDPAFIGQVLEGISNGGENYTRFKNLAK